MQEKKVYRFQFYNWLEPPPAPRRSSNHVVWNGKALHFSQPLDLSLDGFLTDATGESPCTSKHRFSPQSPQQSSLVQGQIGRRPRFDRFERMPAAAQAHIKLADMAMGQKPNTLVDN